MSHLAVTTGRNYDQLHLLDEEKWIGTAGFPLSQHGGGGVETPSPVQPGSALQNNTGFFAPFVNLTITMAGIFQI